MRYAHNMEFSQLIQISGLLGRYGWQKTCTRQTVRQVCWRRVWLKTTREKNSLSLLTPFPTKIFVYSVSVYLPSESTVMSYSATMRKTSTQNKKCSTLLSTLNRENLFGDVDFHFLSVSPRSDHARLIKKQFGLVFLFSSVLTYFHNRLSLMENIVFTLH